MISGSRILRESRDDGYQAVLPFAHDIRERCFESLLANPAGLTAEEVAEVVGCSLNCARSRLTELRHAGRVLVLDKRLNRAGTVRIAVWTLAAVTKDV